MEKQKISKKSIVVWRIRATLILFAAAFILGALFVFFPILSSILAVIIVIAYILAVIIYYPMLYNSTSFTLNKESITIEHGFFIKRKCTLSSKRIQYIVIMSSPIQRVFGICSLSFMTVGSTQILQNITPQDAQKIKSVLEPYKKEVRGETKKP